MIPKERVMKAISHNNVDRVPLDYQAVPNVTKALCRYLELDYENWKKKQKILDVQMAPEPLLRYLGTDLRWIMAPYAGPPLPFNTSIWGTSTHELGGMHVGSYSETVGRRPLSEILSLKQIDKHLWPDPEWWDYSNIEVLCERCDEYAVVLSFGPIACNVFCTCCDLFGLSKFLTIIYKNPEVANAIIEKITNFFLEAHRLLFESAGGKAQIVHMWDDFAHHNGLFMSLEKWRELFKPSLTKFYNLARKYNLKVHQHICGAMRPLIPDLLEIGMDILDPIQVHSQGMVPEDLKAEFGDKLSFHGVIDVQRTLPFGTQKDVRKEVCKRVKVLGKKGGYILTSSHTLLNDIPIENILTMYKQAKKIRLNV